MDKIFRVFDFNIYNRPVINDDDVVESSLFTIQMFGINENKQTCSILVNEFKPFFYVMVDDTWNNKLKDSFVLHIKQTLKHQSASLTNCKFVEKRKLYGFDNYKKHKFLMFEFDNTDAFNKAKRKWYSSYNDGNKLLTGGYKYKNTNTILYEANIPPLLRFFHIQNISPSGWIKLPQNKCIEYSNINKLTKCTMEFGINYYDIIPLNDVENIVPYKIMSFDIEASSSHGDFPVPIKSYKKLASNIIEYFEKHNINNLSRDNCNSTLLKLILAAFGFKHVNEIELVYPKLPPSKSDVTNKFMKWLSSTIKTETTNEIIDFCKLETFFEVNNKCNIDNNNKSSQSTNTDNNDNDSDDDDDDVNINTNFDYNTITAVTTTNNIVDILCNNTIKREDKINIINVSLNSAFPKLEGDKVTFIGSTFMNYGDVQPSLNHCIVLNTCDSNNADNNDIIESYQTEKEVLLAWQQLVQREDPDIVIGYNIFGFDYNFMFKRSEELSCTKEFLKLSRNIDEICGTLDRNSETEKYKIEETTLKIASGDHDLHFIKMNGRLQIDLYNFYRREVNLTSYKLDNVASHFIGDYIKSYVHDNDNTEIHTSNMVGLLEGSYVKFEEIDHSVDYYKNGDKFLVINVNHQKKTFTVNDIISPDVKNKKVRWGLAKDDVSPKDIFTLANGTSADRYIIAKYCWQDCNLCHYLFNKSDIFTGFIEMSKICSVPINFLVMRGQGIKLTSFVSKKCREKGVLMPVIDKCENADGYEGAIVLDPKCGLYLDNPVQCVDFASLYPSTMVSENLSHDSKVWTKEYDLEGNLIYSTGDLDKNGNYLYDNLPGKEYVNCTYDAYKYERKSAKSKAIKIKCGYKICRYVQADINGNEKAILPSILEELLSARKSTRKLIPQQTNDFMKQVLNQRQLGYKVTANSLYGQCGARTSTFYEKDIAACTTATGRKLLLYAKQIIEDCYGDAICDTTNYGKVHATAEYIYGDTDSVFSTFNLKELDGTPITGKKALEITIELGQEAGALATEFLKAPHDLEYEKTFMPFCLLSKKRYVGMLYTYDINKCYRNEMGIVLKRRDNAPIVKDVYGGIIDILMKQQDIMLAIEFLKTCLQNIIDGKYPMNKLIITKSLRSGYKNPKSIAHKVLADRIGEREPGNKPGSGDRIGYVFIVSNNKKALQGDKIETPKFVVDNKLKIDYAFYITNQILKPVQQLFATVLEQIWKLTGKRTLNEHKYKKDIKIIQKSVTEQILNDLKRPTLIKNDLSIGNLQIQQNINDRLNKDMDENTKAKINNKINDKIKDLRNKNIKELIFNSYLEKITNAKNNNQPMTNFFNKK